MSTILFTASAKGGTGKSTAVRFLITYLRAQGADPLLLDLDDENRTLSRFFPEAIRVEIKKRSSHDILVERALDGASLILASGVCCWTMAHRLPMSRRSSGTGNLRRLCVTMPDGCRRTAGGTSMRWMFRHEASESAAAEE